MRYQRTWLNTRFAVGFAAECARLALPFYEGDHRDAVVAAIEAAEMFSWGEDAIDYETAYQIAQRAYDAADVAYDAGRNYADHAARAAGNAASAAADGDSSTDASYGADHAEHVSSTITRPILEAFARWVAKDLDVQIKTELQLNAIIAALTAGNEEVIQDIAP